MVFPGKRQRSLALITIAAVCGFISGAFAPAAAQVSVTVNGRGVDFQPPPIERAGRIFVPLRGVFERLGASVVYENGTINATRGPVTVSLQIGSTQATVSGQPQALDVAPFIVGASTYVPLRFVSQALGANVNYDAANRIVAISIAGHGPPPAAVVPVPVQPVAPPQSQLVLVDPRPARGAAVRSTRPTISADFNIRVEPNSVRVFLDGLDVTQSATRSQTGFVFEPQSPLQSTQHQVRVAGRDLGGARFERTWSFTSGSQPPQNLLDIDRPVDGASVDPGNFVVRGRTAPFAPVRVLAGPLLGGPSAGAFAFGPGNFAGSTTAGAEGRFSLTVRLRGVSTARIGLTVVSTDPRTNEGVEKRLRLNVR
jgi:hypothetical protein